MIRSLPIAAAILGGLVLFSACDSMPPPFSTPVQGKRGFKSRTFVGTPKDVNPAVVATLRSLGYEVHDPADGTGFITANKGMDNGGADPSGARKWTRVEIHVDHIDKHRRAPRTLVSIEAEEVSGSSGGAIEAGFGSVPTEFYESFFSAVSSRVREAQPPRTRGFQAPS